MTVPIQDGKAWGKSLADGFVDSLTERIPTENISSFFSIIGKNIGKTTSETVNEIFQSIGDNLDPSSFENIGTNMGSGINKALFSFGTSLHYEKISEGITDSFEQTGKDFLRLTDELTTDYLIQTLPKILLGIAAFTATPHTIRYLFSVWTHNIGRPKLALEIKNVADFGSSDNFLSKTYHVLKSSFRYAFGKALIPTVALSAFSLYRAPFSPWDHPEYLPEVVIRNTLSVVGLFTAFKISSLVIPRILHPSHYVTKNRTDDAIFEPETSETLKNITKTAQNISKHNGFLQNVLLYGPGGTGKTMISKLIADRSGFNYVMMSGGDLAQYIQRGEHVTELNKLFANIRNSSLPTVLFIDEAESLCRDRGKLIRQEAIELLNAFLNHTGEPEKKLMLILATNRPEDIDPAVLSRMDYKLPIRPPGPEERKKILTQYVPQFFSKQEINTFFRSEDIEELARRTEGMTGRALFKLLNAIAGTKQASDDNQLSRERIEKTIRIFLEQDKELAEA